jgi:hypothetical protein
VGVSSYSYDNSYEVVEFTVPYNAGPGDYKIRIREHRFDGHKEYIAVAWSTRFSRPGDIERGPVR